MEIYIFSFYVLHILEVTTIKKSTILCYFRFALISYISSFIIVILENTHGTFSFYWLKLIVFVFALADVDECQSSPCINGDCTNNINFYTCQCFAGFTGTNCEIGLFGFFYIIHSNIMVDLD